MIEQFAGVVLHAVSNSSNYRERERFEHRHERHYRPVIIQRVHPVYGYAPQRVYYAPPPVYVPAPRHYHPAPVYYSQPAPVYYSQPTYHEAPRVSNSALGTIGGAMVGAAIGNSVGHGHDRSAAMAIGGVFAEPGHVFGH